MHRLLIRLTVVGALLAMAVVLAPGAGAGTIQPTADITKVVDGPGPAGAVYEIEMICEESGLTTVNLMDGQTDSVPFIPGEQCDIAETVTNGAESVSYSCVNVSGVTCVDDQTFFVQPDSVLNPQVSLTVTNTYSPAPTTTTTTTVPSTTTTTVAPAIAVTPAFTG